MASRQEEKEARRQARLEQEAAERRAEARRRRLQMVLGGILAVGIVAGVVVAIMAGGGGEDGGSDGGVASAEAPPGVTLPAQQTSDIDEAVKASGCKLTHPPDEGRGHDDKTFTPADYQQNPPTSGTHFPEWSQDGVYEPGNTPPLGELVHTLEHGRINVQYAPGSSPQLIRQLEAFAAENDGYHMLLYENATDMDGQVAATAWNHSLVCQEAGDRMWDALRTFRDRYLDKGPEQVP